MKELTKALAENKVTIDPTLVMMEAMIWGNDSTYLNHMETDNVSKAFTKQWRNGNLHPYTSWWSDEAHSDAKNLFPVFQKIIKCFWDNGILITAGTDLGNPWLAPGVSLHREFELLACEALSCSLAVLQSCGPVVDKSATRDCVILNNQNDATPNRFSINVLKAGFKYVF